MAARQIVNSKRMKDGQGEENERRGRLFFNHKGRGEEMMWEKQTGSLAGLPNV